MCKYTDLIFYKTLFAKVKPVFANFICKYSDNLGIIDIIADRIKNNFETI